VPAVRPTRPRSKSIYRLW